MKNIKTLEKYRAEDITSKYYVWKMPSFPTEKFAVIEILDVNNSSIKYKAIRRTDWRYKDFFTERKNEKSIFGDLVSLSIWKRNKAGGLLFETDSEEDAITFLKLRLENKDVNKDNFETYKNADKYNL